jgi:serine/threonine-protein kinase
MSEPTTGPRPDTAGELLRLWAQGGAPDVDAFLAGAGPLSAAEVAAALRVDQRQRWQAGRGVPAEQYLARHPALRADPEAALDLIFHEFLLRERAGERPGKEEYLKRFPRHAAALADQIDLHRAVAGDAGATGTAAGAPAAPEADAAPAALPGYEVLEELGRGGMGVVFKARQVGLDRLVALKVVLAGEFAGASERARFRAEALAAARLSHPNVVQVFEVGEHQGHPYLALEYVEAGTLADRLRGGPLPPRQAAELIQQLARAAQVAHDRGVVHRDLKPANVLLTRDGTPKVTDFGLAKRLDAQTAATQSGAVVGTPAYMAPEQAAGKTREVGPAADVWALGVILYECLTGRPPFQAATPLDTVVQVLTAEPVPPRRLRPGVPRDLQTVCLHCLDKEPRKRYPSALALADDLGRWLAGESIKARPVGRVGRLWRWCRRRPAVAVLLLALALSLLAGAGTSAYLLRTRRGSAGPDAEALVARGRLHLQRKEYDRALAAYGEALRLDPRHATAHAERADAYVGLGRPDEAVAECVAAMRLEPDLVTKHVRWAKAHTNGGQHEHAVVGCTAVLRVAEPQLAKHRSSRDAGNPQLRWAVAHTADAYFVRSNAHAMLRHWDAAADDFARYAASQRDLPQMALPFNEACRLLGKGDRQGYRKVCARALGRSAELSKASEVYLIARMCLLSADSGVAPAEALRLAEAAVRAQRVPWHLHTLGLAYYRTGQYDLAIRRLQDASQTVVGPPAMTPNNWLVLAMAQHRKGQPAEARRWLDAAVRRPVPCMHPHERVAYQILRREAEAMLRGRGHE